MRTRTDEQISITGEKGEGEKKGSEKRESKDASLSEVRFFF